MKKNIGYRIVAVGLLVACVVTAPLSSVSSAEKGKGPIKVFILAGQSNMEGQGLIEFSRRRAAGYKKRGMSDEATRGTPWTMIIDKKGVIRYGAFHITPEDAGKLIEKLKAEKLVSNGKVAPAKRARPSQPSEE